MPCYRFGNAIVCCPKTTEKRTEETAMRWCFQCRSRRVFRLFVVFAEWYGPDGRWRCSQDPTGERGHTDLFPGWEREALEN